MAVCFVDSSALSKRYIDEIGSTWVISLFDPVRNNDILIAAITSVEILAAITRRGLIVGNPNNYPSPSQP